MLNELQFLQCALHMSFLGRKERERLTALIQPAWLNAGNFLFKEEDWGVSACQLSWALPCMVTSRFVSLATELTDGLQAIAGS